MRTFRWHDELKNDNAIHFVTSVTKGRTRTFDDVALALLLLGEIHGYAERYSMTLFASVVMPDHFHAILWPQGKRTVPEFMKGVKGFTAKKVAEYRRGAGTPPMDVWQDEYFDHLITDETTLEEKIWYIIRNPIEDNLIAEGGEYPYLFVQPDYDPR